MDIIISCIIEILLRNIIADVMIKLRKAGAGELHKYARPSRSSKDAQEQYQRAEEVVKLGFTEGE